MAMSIKQLKRALNYLPKKMSVMLTGYHGIGKTQWVKQYAKEQGLQLVIWHASHAADAGDITGLPYKATVTIIQPDGTTREFQVTRFAPPEWMLQNKPTLVLLDEINRGMAVALNAIMQLTCDQTYDAFTLPEGSRVFACINPDEHGYDVSTLDPAQISRFAVYEFAPSKEELITYLDGIYGPNIITCFLNKYERYIDPWGNCEITKTKTNSNSTTKGKDDMKQPDRRMWENVIQLWKNLQNDHLTKEDDDIDFFGEIVRGMVGIGAATELVSFIKKHGDVIGPKEVMETESKEDWDIIATRIADYDLPSTVLLAKNCGIYLKNLDNFSGKKVKDKELTKKYADNFLKLLNLLEPEAKIAVASGVIFDAIDQQERWAMSLCAVSSELNLIVLNARTSKAVKL